MSVPFNPNQLASYSQARTLRDYLNANKIGRGVVAGDDEAGITVVPNAFSWLPPIPARPGIYLPSWSAGPGGFEEPNAIDADGAKLLFLHMRFLNGFEGANVGLILDKFRRYPHSPEYVLGELAKEYGA